MNNLAWKLFFSAVKFQFRSFQLYQRLQRVLFYTKGVRVYLTSLRMTSRNMKLTTTMADLSLITDFAN